MKDTTREEIRNIFKESFSFDKIIRKYYEKLILNDRKCIFDAEIIEIIDNMIKSQSVTFLECLELFKRISYSPEPNNPLSSILHKITSDERFHLEKEKVHELREIERNLCLRIFENNQLTLRNILQRLGSNTTDKLVLEPETKLLVRSVLIYTNSSVNRETSILELDPDTQRQYMSKFRAILNLFKTEFNVADHLTLDELNLLDFSDQAVFIGFINCMTHYYMNSTCENFLCEDIFKISYRRPMTKNILDSLLAYSEHSVLFSMLICLQFNWPLTLTELRVITSNQARFNLTNLLRKIADSCLRERKIFCRGKKRHILINALASHLKIGEGLSLMQMLLLLRHLPDSCLRVKVSLKICQFILYKKFDARLFMAREEFVQTIQPLAKIERNNTPIQELNINQIAMLNHEEMLHYILLQDSNCKATPLPAQKTLHRLEKEEEQVRQCTVNLLKYFLERIKGGSERFHVKRFDILLLLQMVQIVNRENIRFLEFFEELHRYLMEELENIELSVDIVTACLAASQEIINQDTYREFEEYLEKEILKKYTKMEIGYTIIDFKSKRREYYYRVDKEAFIDICNNINYINIYKGFNMKDLLRLKIWIYLNCEVLDNSHLPVSLFGWYRKNLGDFTDSQLDRIMYDFHELTNQAKVMNNQAFLIEAERIQLLLQKTSVKYIPTDIVEAIFSLMFNSNIEQVQKYSSSNQIIRKLSKDIDLTQLRSTSVREILNPSPTVLFPPEPIITYVLVDLSRVLFHVEQPINLLAFEDKLILFSTLYAMSFYTLRNKETILEITKQLLASMRNQSRIILGENSLKIIKQSFHDTILYINDDLTKISRRFLNEIHSEMSGEDQRLLLFTVFILNRNSYGSLLRIRSYLLDVDNALLSDIKQDEYQIFLLKISSNNGFETNITYLISLIFLETVIEGNELRFLDSLLLFFVLNSDERSSDISSTDMLLTRILFESLTRNITLNDRKYVLQEMIQGKIDEFLETFEGTIDESLLRGILSFRSLRSDNTMTPFLCYLCVEDNRELFREIRRKFRKNKTYSTSNGYIDDLKVSILHNIDGVEYFYMKTSTLIMLSMASTIFDQSRALYQCLDIVQGGQVKSFAFFKEMIQKAHQHLDSLIETMLDEIRGDQSNDQLIDSIQKRIVIYGLYNEYRIVVLLNSLRILSTSEDLLQKSGIIIKILESYKASAPCRRLSFRIFEDSIRVLDRIYANAEVTYIEFLCLNKCIQMTKVDQDGHLILKAFFNDYSITWSKEGHRLEFPAEYLPLIRELIYFVIEKEFNESIQTKPPLVVDDQVLDNCLEAEFLAQSLKLYGNEFCKKLKYLKISNP